MSKLILKIQQEIAFLEEKLILNQNIARQSAADLAVAAVESLDKSTMLNPKFKKKALEYWSRCNLLKRKISEVKQFLETL